MELEERIKSLEERVKVLEDREKRRKIMGIIKAVIIVLLYAAILFAAYKVYQQFQETIKPITEFTEATEDYDINSIINKYINNK